MKNYFSNRNEISRVNVIFAMVLIMAGIAYYYLINLTSDLRWVMMCGYLFLAIPAIFTLIHGLTTKRSSVALLSIGFVILGILGFASKILHGLNYLTSYNYLFNAAYAISTIFVFSFADRLCVGKNLFKKWWFVVLIVIFCIVPTVLTYVVPENTLNIIITIKSIAYILVNLAAFLLGVSIIFKKKYNGFGWAYAIYAFAMLVAYVFQVTGGVRWYNLFLMLALIAAPYVLLTAVKSNE